MLCVRGILSPLRAVLACAAIIAIGNVATSAADEFQNLDFEDAWIAKPYYDSDAMPGWANDNFEPGYVVYDNMSLGSTCISIHDGINEKWPIHPLQGRYTVLLQSGSLNGTFQHAWISQTGDVPSDARSLMFETDTTGLVGATIGVSMNGIPIRVSLYSVGPTVNANYGPIKTFIGDISAFAGHQDVALRFEAVPPAGLTSCNMDLDAITFSSIVVPEPSALVLLAIGVLTACIFRLRRRRPSEV